MVEKVITSARVVVYNGARGGGNETTVRTCAQSVEDRPASNSKGSVIVFPNGSTFRKHTSHSVSKAWYEDGGGLTATAKIQEPLWSGNQGSLMTGPGGGADHFLNFAKTECLSGIDIGNTRKPPAIPTGRQNEVVTKALIGLASQNANLGEALATLHQTFRLVSNPLSSLVKGIRKVAEDGSFRPFLSQTIRDINRAGPLNVAAKRYLEYVYGWRPLMQDIHDIIALGKEKAQTPLLLSNNVTTRQGGTGPSYVYEDYSTKEVSYFDAVNYQDRVSCTLVARVDPEYAGIRTLNQLGLANPLALAWELVPFSFIVDWVIPIGTMLESFTAPAGLQFVTGSVSRRVTASCPYKATTTAFDQSYPSFSDVKITEGTGTFRYEGYTRELLAFWPSTGLWIDMDPLRGDRSLKATALSIALLGKGRSLRTIR